MRSKKIKKFYSLDSEFSCWPSLFSPFMSLLSNILDMLILYENVKAQKERKQK